MLITHVLCSCSQIVVASVDYVANPMGFAEHFRATWDYEKVASNLRFGWPSGVHVKLVMYSPFSGFGVFNGSLCFAFSKGKDEMTDLLALDLPDNFEVRSSIVSIELLIPFYDRTCRLCMSVMETSTFTTKSKHPTMTPPLCCSEYQAS